MDFQSYGFESITYNPIELGHTSATAPMTIGGVHAGCSSKKRKAFDEMDTLVGGAEYQVRPKLSLPRSAGLVFNADARFHPLPGDANQAVLAQLRYDRLTAGASSGSSSNFETPPSSSSRFGHQYKDSAGSDYFSTAVPSQYPDVEPYPSTSPSTTFGILGPAPGRHNSFSDADDMQVDYASNRISESVHGPQCKSIPQLCVRYNDGMGSQLWATCPDCGACSRVESSQPSQLCHSP